MQLTEHCHVPSEYHAACDRFTALIQQHTRRLLDEEYWSDDHIDQLQAHSGTPYTYIRDDEYDSFDDINDCIYSRAKRSVYHRVTHVLDAHAAEHTAFHFVLDTVKEGKIRRIGWRRLRDALFNDESPYVEWRVLEHVVDTLNEYFDTHGRFPDAYTDLVACPEPNGTIPFAPDKGDYHIHEVEIDDGDLLVMVNAPDSLTPSSYSDWTEHRMRFTTHARFDEMVTVGEIGAPTLHASDHGYTIDVPVDVPKTTVDTRDDRVLAVDVGVSKQATCVPLDHGDGEGGEHEQVAPPAFVDHHAKPKLLRVKADAEGINDRLATLRRDGNAHTDRFDHLLAEFRKTRRRERRLRAQIQHDVANQLVWIALQHECRTIVFESLGDLGSREPSGKTAWSISSWARGDLLDNVEYKAELLGLDVKTVNPWGTSRYCPRCGERGCTVTAPNDHTECRHGGHFYCPHCGYECDRDVVGALNVGRKWFDECKMEHANPADYMSAGNHASFPSRTRSDNVGHREVGGVRARSAGVQSTPVTGMVSGWQSQRPLQSSAPLHARRATRGEDDTVGLHKNHGGERDQLWVAGSVTRYALTRTTNRSRLQPNTTEN